MSLNLAIYSNSNSSTRYVTFEVGGDVLAASDSGPWYPSNVACQEFYVKITTTATQDNGNSYPVKIVKGLSDLALNTRNVAQKQREHNYSNAYPDIKSMVIDFMYDFAAGHSSNTYGSQCSFQGPMKFD